MQKPPIRYRESHKSSLIGHRGIDVAQDHKHRGLLQFIRKILDVPLGRSKEDLVTFRSVASKEYSSVVPLIDEYIRLSERADTEALPEPSDSKRKPGKAEAGHMHLFDMLRDKRLFPSNSDLSEFAGRVLPNMSRNRFDKMSRGD